MACMQRLAEGHRWWCLGEKIAHKDLRTNANKVQKQLQLWREKIGRELRILVSVHSSYTTRENSSSDELRFATLMPILPIM
mmetsp:Transcript_33125/g.50055  ORF Transcript_33125/g.50055 Transcript_33125/m.50055 type:complete len:81 (+) Transcript_33125:229-471(+)